MRKIRFEHKGQMINYYNKIKDNAKIKTINFYLDANEGYVLTYKYF